MVFSNKLKDKRVLITCGPTWIPIDDTRIISNKSTGELGQLAAKYIAKTGARVTLLEGPVTESLESKLVKVIKFNFYDDFYQIFEREVKKKYDCIIHAAAVSDYKLKKPFKSKLSSKLNKISLELVPTEKIVYIIKDHHPETFLVGFKLETHIDKVTAIEKSKYLFDKAHCDLVVANSTTDQKYRGFIINNQPKILSYKKNRKEIIKTLVRILKKQL